ncbi:mobilization protein [Lactiplantibacillus plantarum]|uniref:MobQ family relaxase n=2 Tax=Lactiplantibacillus plantarum TaxID=1590 RepID=UPI0007B17C18|nr:MobQ family relaxase [Lactiplantibacillus plantarum]KZD99403.1 mobilization protein [Lactiplantibacillus plantarum]
MAIYHLSLKTISRSKGQSAVASSAYRSGSKLKDFETGEVKDFTKKHGVAYSEIQLPAQAPAKYKDREELWNAVEEKESKSNSQLAREVEVALPSELERPTQIKLVHDYVQTNFVDRGMCADWSIHDKEDGNPHAHIMLTTRAIKKNGTWAPKQKSTYVLDEDGAKVPQIDSKTGQQKIGARGRKMWQRTTESYTDWNDRNNAEIWRKSWAESCNQYLAPDNKIDHRSYERQGVERLPTVHEGHVAREMGRRSERVQTNQQIKASNQQILALEQVLMELRLRIKELVKQVQEAINERIRRSEFNRINNETGRVDSEKRAIDESTTDTQSQRQPATQLSRVAELSRQIEQRERDTEQRKPTTTQSSQSIDRLTIAIGRTKQTTRDLGTDYNRQSSRKRRLGDAVKPIADGLQRATKRKQLTAMNKAKTNQPSSLDQAFKAYRSRLSKDQKVKQQAKIRQRNTQHKINYQGGHERGR